LSETIMPHPLQISSPDSGSVIIRRSLLHTGQVVGDDDDGGCGCIIENYFAIVSVKSYI
jgi:hypothetical protein